MFIFFQDVFFCVIVYVLLYLIFRISLVGAWYYYFYRIEQEIEAQSDFVNVGLVSSLGKTSESGFGFSVLEFGWIRFFCKFFREINKDNLVFLSFGLVTGYIFRLCDIVLFQRWRIGVDCGFSFCVDGLDIWIFVFFLISSF